MQEKKKEKSGKKSGFRAIKTHFFSSSSAPLRLVKLKERIQPVQEERTWALSLKKGKKRKERVDCFISITALLSSSLLALSRLSPQSRIGGARSISALPDCQSVSRKSCQVARFAPLAAADWTPLQSRRPAREGREWGEEPPVTHFHAWPNKVNGVDDVTSVQLRRRWDWGRGRSFQGCSSAIGCRGLSVSL